jgi:hypothetical protein
LSSELFAIMTAGRWCADLLRTASAAGQTHGSAWPVNRWGILLRICDLEPAARLNTRDLHKPLAAGTLDLLYDHGHGRDDGTYGQSEASHPLLTLGLADVMQS